MTAGENLKRTKRNRLSTAQGSSPRRNRNSLTKRCKSEQIDCFYATPQNRIRSGSLLEDCGLASESSPPDLSLEQEKKSTNLRRSKRACSLLATGRLRNLYPPVDLFGPEEDFVELVKEVRRTHKLDAAADDDDDHGDHEVEAEVDQIGSQWKPHTPAGTGQGCCPSEHADDIESNRDLPSVEIDTEIKLATLSAESTEVIGKSHEISFARENTRVKDRDVEVGRQRNCSKTARPRGSISEHGSGDSEPFCEAVSVPKQDGSGTPMRDHFAQSDRENTILGDDHKTSGNNESDPGAGRSPQRHFTHSFQRSPASGRFWNGFELNDPSKVCF